MQLCSALQLCTSAPLRLCSITVLQLCSFIMPTIDNQPLCLQLCLAIDDRTRRSGRASALHGPPAACSWPRCQPRAVPCAFFAHAQQTQPAGHRNPHAHGTCPGRPPQPARTRTRHARPWPWPWALPVGTAGTTRGTAHCTAAGLCAGSTALSVLSICTQEDLHTLFALLKHVLKWCLQTPLTWQTITSAMHCKLQTVQTVSALHCTTVQTVPAINKQIFR